ncbi:MFS transporter [Acetobacteraceae bacterium]|nr:MFS transporter [Acetobacteraceae bacterium]
MRAFFALMLAVLLECTFLGVGISVIPLFVVQTLHCSAGVSGIVVGVQFIAAMLSRFPSGRISDVKGPYSAMSAGALSAVIGGAFYAAASISQDYVFLSVVLLFCGSALLGIAQSVLATGAMTGSVSLMEQVQKAQKQAGKAPSSKGPGAAISWVGMCIFLGLILGAPMGVLLFEKTGLFWAGLVIALCSAVVQLWCYQSSKADLKNDSAGNAQEQGNFWEALGYGLYHAWFPGFCFGLCAISHGLIIAYASLLYAEHHWFPLWLPYAVFGIALVLARLFLGSLPDRLGGAKTAFFSAFFETVGLILVTCASNLYLSSIGIFLTGFGFAFAFPAFALITLQRGDSAHRGVLIGICNALGDGVRGVGIVCLGYLTALGGFSLVFFSGAFLSLLGGVGGVSLFFLGKKARIKKPASE